MLKSYLKIAFRHLRKDKTHAVINLAGLALGLACAIIVLLSSEFAKLVLLANLISGPVAYYAMNKWLQDFAYRIEISWWVFALAGGVALLIALLTVSAQAIKAALANPVEALRYE